MWPEFSEHSDDSAAKQKEEHVQIRKCLWALVKPYQLQTLRGIVVLALLAEQSERDLLQRRVQTPAARLILPGWVDGLIFQ